MIYPIPHPYATRGTRYGTSEFPPQFKPVNGRYRPVQGGRWSVRKLVDGRWRAWTNGGARRYSHRFYTHHVAVRWATTVARAYRVRPFPTTDIEFRRLLDDHYRRYRKADLIIHLRRGGRVDASIIERIMELPEGAWDDSWFAKYASMGN